MRKRAAALIYLFTALSCHADSGPASEAPRTRVARLGSLTGSAEVLRGGSSDWVALRPGTELFDDDRVRTYKGARAFLVFVGGSSLKVEEESLISLGALSAEGGVVIERGTVEGQLAAGLKLRTPTLEAESAPARDIVIQ